LGGRAIWIAVSAADGLPLSLPPLIGWLQAAAISAASAMADALSLVFAVIVCSLKKRIEKK
jgi:hypothetical protein